MTDEEYIRMRLNEGRSTPVRQPALLWSVWRHLRALLNSGIPVRQG